MKKFNNSLIQQDLAKLKEADNLDVRKTTLEGSLTEKTLYTIEAGVMSYMYFDQKQRNQDFNQLKTLTKTWRLLKIG